MLLGTASFDHLSWVGACPETTDLGKIVLNNGVIDSH